MEKRITIEDKLHKIQSLMERGYRTTSEHEARICFLKAQELMAKWNLDMEQIKTKTEEDEKIESEYIFQAGATRTSWKMELARIIANNYRTKFFLSLTSDKTAFIVFFGKKEDTAICKTIFLQAIKILEKGRTKAYDHAYNRQMSTRGVRGDYTRGFLYGLKKALETQKDEQGWGLVLTTPKEVEEAFQKIQFSRKDFNLTATKYHGNTQYFQMGQQDGKEMIPSERKKFIAEN